MVNVINDFNCTLLLEPLARYLVTISCSILVAKKRNTVVKYCTILLLAGLCNITDVR